VNKTTPWEVPTEGVATFRVDFCPVAAKAGQMTVQRQVQNFIAVLPDFSNAMDAARLTRTYMTLHPEQAQSIFDRVLKLVGQWAGRGPSLLPHRFMTQLLVHFTRGLEAARAVSHRRGPH
jgi:hypothetical protein